MIHWEDPIREKVILTIKLDQVRPDFSFQQVDKMIGQEHQEHKRGI